MRFRTDGWHYADLKCAGITPEKFAEWHGPNQVEAYKNFPAAEPGDIWRIHWYAPEGQQGPIAGYAICCPKCKRVHAWTTATNCSQKTIERSYTDKDGKVVKYKSCPHEGTGSCWNWSGSAENNTLTASPSLFNQAPDCGWHGWLQNGVLRG